MRFPELLIIQSAKFPANPQAPPVPASPAGFTAIGDAERGLLWQ
jgi:hypothetical protein